MDSNISSHKKESIKSSLYESINQPINQSINGSADVVFRLVKGAANDGAEEEKVWQQTAGQRMKAKMYFFFHK